MCDIQEYIMAFFLKRIICIKTREANILLIRLKQIILLLRKRILKLETKTCLSTDRITCDISSIDSCVTRSALVTHYSASLAITGQAVLFVQTNQFVISCL